MRKLVILTFVSLDGVMQAPGGKGEDPSGGFEHEGWSVPLFDEELGQTMGEQMGKPFDLLLGKTTYEIFAGYWPKHNDESGKGINKATKYVVTDEEVDTSWEKTVKVSGDVVGGIRKLKAGDGAMLQVHGSSELIQTLLAEDLADELWLKTYPLTLGKGKRLWGKGTRPAAFKLLESKATPSGVIVANYRRNGDVVLGSII